MDVDPNRYHYVFKLAALRKGVILTDFRKETSELAHCTIYKEGVD